MASFLLNSFMFFLFFGTDVAAAKVTVCDYMENNIEENYIFKYQM